MKHQLRNSNSHKHQLKKLDGIQNHWLVANSFMMTFHIELIKWLTISIPNPYQVDSLRMWGLISLYIKLIVKVTLFNLTCVLNFYLVCCCTLVFQVLKENVSSMEGKKKWVCGSVLCEINVTSCARFLDFTSTTKSLQIKW